MNHVIHLIIATGACLALAACGGSSPAGDTGGGAAGGTTTSTSTATGTTSTSTATGTTSGTSACALTADTTPTSDVGPTGCAVLDRDTSGCSAARKAAGLSGFWLNFSCRVSLSVSGGVVMAAADGQPDYESDYFAMTNACYVADPSSVHNPSEIVPQTYVVQFPLSPSTTSQQMMGGTVGLALNGVPIFDNQAAPGDDIYTEAKTFDACGGHPQMSGQYHYHSEPYAISYDDDRFIGVMRDGYPVYGRKDPDGSSPTLDAYGGHTGTTVDSPSTAVYHYHVNQQTSTSASTAGQMIWFLTTGTYRGAPGACGSCM